MLAVCSEDQNIVAVGGQDLCFGRWWNLDVRQGFLSRDAIGCASRGCANRNIDLGSRNISALLRRVFGTLSILPNVY